MRPTVLAALAIGTLICGPASAAEVIIDDGYDDPDVVEAAPPEEAPYIPPVYGWTSAPPIDCGTYGYWNGDNCADARDEPPASSEDED
jgi:hypothetical protein